MKIAVLGHLKHAIRRPYAGGLEMFTDVLVRQLVARGHDVTLFGSGDSESAGHLYPVVPNATVPSYSRLAPEYRWEAIEQVEDRAYSETLDQIRISGFDVVHNNTLSPVVLRAGVGLATPFVTTLHVPPLPRMVAAIEADPAIRTLPFVNVSSANVAVWSPHIPDQQIVHNAVDTGLWRMSKKHQSPRAIWSGRILADKGTHLAVEAAHQSGLPIDIAGPIADEDYFDTFVLPRLRPGDQYLGHLEHNLLRDAVAAAHVAIVTPCWEEPFGLVVAEAQSSGTPVATFARGGPRDLVEPLTGRLAIANNVESLAQAIRQCLQLDPVKCRRRAVRRFSMSAMVDDYERIYGNLIHDRLELLAEVVA